MKTLNCKICYVEFITNKNAKKYCSVLCSKKAKAKYTQIYQQNHRKKTREYVKKFRLLHPDLITERNKKFSQTPEGIYSSLKTGATSRNLEYSITKEYFVNWYNNQDKTCHYCNRTLEEIKLDPIGHAGRLSIDRIDSTKGYIENNLVLACYRCNTIKSNYFTEQEMLKIGEIIKLKELK